MVSLARTKTKAGTRTRRLDPARYCGCCYDWRSVWCPDCCGFDGCATCDNTRRVACPVCAGGTREPIYWP